jgi:endogenous inhibitor of DNA gyrase (YacG/DUF329 family)
MSLEADTSLCALCRKRPVQAQWRPFCSERCKLLDLANWADGTYRVAAEPVTTASEPGDEADPPNTDR